MPANVFVGATAESRKRKHRRGGGVPCEGPGHAVVRRTVNAVLRAGPRADPRGVTGERIDRGGRRCVRRRPVRAAVRSPVDALRGPGEESAARARKNEESSDERWDDRTVRQARARRLPCPAVRRLGDAAGVALIHDAGCLRVVGYRQAEAARSLQPCRSGVRGQKSSRRAAPQDVRGIRRVAGDVGNRQAVEPVERLFEWSVGARARGEHDAADKLRQLPEAIPERARIPGPEGKCVAPADHREALPAQPAVEAPEQSVSVHQEGTSRRSDEDVFHVVAPKRGCPGRTAVGRAEGAAVVRSEVHDRGRRRVHRERRDVQIREALVLRRPSRAAIRALVEAAVERPDVHDRAVRRIDVDGLRPLARGRPAERLPARTAVEFLPIQPSKLTA